MILVRSKSIMRNLDHAVAKVVSHFIMMKIMAMHLVKSSKPLVGYTVGAYPCFNDVKRLRSCHFPLARTSV